MPPPVGGDRRDRSDVESLRAEPHRDRCESCTMPTDRLRRVGDKLLCGYCAKTSDGAPSEEGATVPVTSSTTKLPCPPGGVADHSGEVQRASDEVGGERTAPVLRRARRRFRARRREWIESDGLTLAQVLDQLDAETSTGYLIGRRAGGGTIDGLREWSADVPAGWRPADAGHWIKGAFPVLRYTDHYDRTVELHRAASWFGDDATTPAECEAAWRELERAVSVTFDEGALLDTPAATGRYLLLRSVPFSRSWPCLSEDDQALVRATSGQGRTQVIPRGAETLPRLYRLDGRFMYSALCWGLGSGPVQRDRLAVFEPQRRGRYLVTATVPAGWEHVGILPAIGDDGWLYPAEPGQSFKTWADGCEVAIALRHGWGVKVHERFLLDYDGTGPLDTWATKLRRLRARDQAPMLAGAWRRILLHGIGALHGRPRSNQHASTDESDVPADAIGWHMQGDVHVWTTAGEAPTWAEMSHPEWSAAIWARCRARLLDGPQSTGVLHVDPAHVVGFRTDAVYLTEDPAWPDDGKEGRFRCTGRWTDVPAPASGPELLAVTHGE